MGRLIDADKLRMMIRNNAPKSVPLWVYETIDRAPTAYDVDAVVEQLEELPRCSTWNHNSDNIDRKRTIEIVKGWGVDD